MHAEVSAKWYVLGVHRSRGKMSSSTAIISSSMLGVTRRARGSWAATAAELAIAVGLELLAMVSRVRGLDAEPRQ